MCHLPLQLGIYLLGGSDGTESVSRRTLFLQAYKTPVTKPPMGQKRSCFPSVFGNFEQAVYAFGGWDGDTVLKSCERFEIANNQWIRIANLNTARRDASVQSFEKIFFVFGGLTKAKYVPGLEMVDTIEKYVIELDMWQVLMIRMTEPLRTMISFPLGGGRILLFGQRHDKQMNAQIIDLTQEFCEL